MTDWRDIPGHPGYQASDDGRVRSVDRVVVDKNGRRMRWRGAELTPTPDVHGYLRVAVPGSPRPVNRLVCMAFHGAAPDGRPHAAHRDGDRLNNRPGNLYWATRSENERDKVRHGGHYLERRTHCNYGHEFTPENTYYAPGRPRACRQCRAVDGRARYLRKKADA
jgi:hypothetical protein